MVYYQREAHRQGDIFDVLVSANAPMMGATQFGTTKKIRSAGSVSSDTPMLVQGTAGHHPTRIKETLHWLEENYDGIFFAQLVPHPTKEYGGVPLFLPLYRDLKLPKVATISDGYWHNYADWGRRAIPHLQALFTGCAAYAVPLEAEGFKVSLSRRPFYPLKVEPVARSKSMLTCWMSQWKDIKGIHRFLHVIPKLPGKIELYSCGIRYYQFRETEMWKQAIGKDHFKGYDGVGKSEYFGNISMQEAVHVFQRAWFSVNLQGITGKPGEATRRNLFGGTITNPKAVYRQGSYNNTETEALYYGCVPVVHNQVRKSEIPGELYLSVDVAEELLSLLRSKQARDLVYDPLRAQRAREWVMEYHNPTKIYNQLKEALTR
jgi:hypothetical protein